MSRWRNIYPSGDHHLHHGYTCRDVHRLARLACSQRHPYGVAFDDLLEAAWSGIVIALYAADAKPDHGELLRAATSGITRLVETLLRSQGLAWRSAEVVPMVQYYRYWWDAWRFAGCPESAVVDTLSLYQIWPLLKPHHQATLVALALHRDHQLAAQSMGITQRAYHSRLRKARRTFLALWHEHEQPSRLWGRDEPRSTQSAMRGLRERTRRVAQAGAS